MRLGLQGPKIAVILVCPHLSFREVQPTKTKLRILPWLHDDVGAMLALESGDEPVGRSAAGVGGIDSRMPRHGLQHVLSPLALGLERAGGRGATRFRERDRTSPVDLRAYWS